MSSQIVTLDILHDVAGKVFSTTQWLARYGAPVYALENLLVVERLCDQGKLPPGWDSRKHDWRYYLYHPLGPKGDFFAFAPHTPTLPAAVIRSLQQARERGFRPGEVSQLARRYGVSAAYISRLSRGQRGARTLHNPRAKWRLDLLDHDALRRLALDADTLQAVCARLLTIQQWCAWFGPRYETQHTEAARVRPLCADDRLPGRWRALYLAASWRIYHESLATVTELVAAPPL